VTKTISI